MFTTSLAPNNLNAIRLLEEISAFVEGQINGGFLESLYSNEERICKIEEYYRRINAILGAFQVNLHYSTHVQRWTQQHNARYLHS
jgi:hypothetical protein